MPSPGSVAGDAAWLRPPTAVTPRERNRPLMPCPPTLERPHACLSIAPNLLPPEAGPRRVARCFPPSRRTLVHGSRPQHADPGVSRSTREPPRADW